jgi:hypothetical protein
MTTVTRRAFCPTGRGTAVDKLKSFDWYQRSKDVPASQYNIATFYHNGVPGVVACDYKQALDWYHIEPSPLQFHSIIIIAHL